MKFSNNKSENKVRQLIKNEKRRIKHIENIKTGKKEKNRKKVKKVLQIKKKCVFLYS